MILTLIILLKLAKYKKRPKLILEDYKVDIQKLNRPGPLNRKTQILPRRTSEVYIKSRKGKKMAAISEPYFADLK